MDNRITDKQRKAIKMFLTGKSWSSIAKVMKIPEDTLLDWRLTNAFSHQLAVYGERLLSEQTALSPLCVSTGIEAMLSIATDDNVPSYVRQKTSQCLIDYGLATTERVRVIEDHRAEIDYRNEQKDFECKQLDLFSNE